MKKCNGIGVAVLVALCIAPQRTYAEQEGMSAQKKIGLGLGAVAVSGLGYWGIPKIC